VSFAGSCFGSLLAQAAPSGAPVGSRRVSRPPFGMPWRLPRVPWGGFFGIMCCASGRSSGPKAVSKRCLDDILHEQDTSEPHFQPTHAQPRRATTERCVVMVYAYVFVCVWLLISEATASWALASACVCVCVCVLFSGPRLPGRWLAWVCSRACVCVCAS
jgi:hypothetical protein